MAPKCRGMAASELARQLEWKTADWLSMLCVGSRADKISVQRSESTTTPPHSLFVAPRQPRRPSAPPILQRLIEQLNDNS